MTIQELLDFTIKRQASDLQLVAGEIPRMKLHGELNKIHTLAIDKDTLDKMLYSLMTEEQIAKYKENLDIDFAITHNNNRFRVNISDSLSGMSVSFRAIPLQTYTLEELYLPNVITNLCHLKKGLILVTGCTGTGKSTTLTAMVNYINKNLKRNIILIEDPTEYIHTSDKSLITHRELNVNTLSYPSALKSALRANPDIIVLGELRDIQTIRTALTAAETGHLVFSTLHTNSATMTINRIVDAFPGDEKNIVRTIFANSIQAIISQFLVSRADKEGLVAVQEILTATDAARATIREGKIHQLQSIIQTSSKYGMQTAEKCMESLVERKLINKQPRNENELRIQERGNLQNKNLF